MIRTLSVVLAATWLTACTDGSDTFLVTPPEAPLPDFATADAWLADFVETQPLFPGASIILVDGDRGVMHKSVFGNQTDDSLVLLASTTKVPTVMLLMALHDDASIDFDIQTPIANYLPWEGVWDAAITTENLVSNRSGIPGLDNLTTRFAAYAPHLCQFLPGGTLMECAETLYTTPLPAIPNPPADTAFDYGGSQWQIAGAVAEFVGGATWNQLWDQYIGEPCGLEMTRYGNNLSFADEWTGNADALEGLDNPSMEGGMMSSLDDYAKLLSVHLNDGYCGDQQVVSAQSLAFMREERTPIEGSSRGYGMGWWLTPPPAGGEVYLYVDPGAYGSVSWIDTSRNYGGVVFFEEYTLTGASTGSRGVVSDLIPLIEAAIDATR
jgi:CubicO group peptidase (beta-lactamase class C family)